MREMNREGGRKTDSSTAMFEIETEEGCIFILPSLLSPVVKRSVPFCKKEKNKQKTQLKVWKYKENNNYKTKYNNFVHIDEI